MSVREYRIIQRTVLRLIKLLMKVPFKDTNFFKEAINTLLLRRSETTFLHNPKDSTSLNKTTNKGFVSNSIAWSARTQYARSNAPNLSTNHQGRNPRTRKNAPIDGKQSTVISIVGHLLTCIYFFRDAWNRGYV